VIDLFILMVMAALATWAAVETWHHGEIFARQRAYWEVREGFFAELLTCPFCLSHWVSLAFTGLAFANSKDANQLFFVPAFWLAATRLSNLFNDVFHGWCRTPNRIKLSEEDLAQLKEIGENHGEESPGDTNTG
jgi:hypothetical protein